MLATETALAVSTVRHLDEVFLSEWRLAALERRRPRLMAADEEREEPKDKVDENERGNGSKPDPPIT